jgi:hypothetical protein
VAGITVISMPTTADLDRRNEMAVRVKVPVAKVIAALENKITENQEKEERNKIAEKNYQEAMEKYNAKLVKDLKDSVKVNSLSLRSWSNTLTVEYQITEGAVLPEEPKRSHESTLGNWQLEEIQNALNILKMTEDEFVNASTMKDISKYL